MFRTSWCFNPLPLTFILHFKYRSFMISTQVHTRGFLSILLTSQQIPTLQIKSNCSFCEEPGHGACSQYSSQSRVSSELTWSQTPQSELQFPPRDTQPRFQSLHSRWVLIFFFSSQGLNRTSPFIGTGIHKDAQFSSLLSKLQFQRHFQLSVTYNCIGNHKNIQKTQPPLTLISLTSQNRDLCFQLHFCLVLILLHLSHKLMSIGKKII